MEELFNRPILDQLYDSISDDFETMLLKKKRILMVNLQSH